MLTITPRASSYIESTGINPIRFGVKPNKGCAGFEYDWDVVKTAEELDKNNEMIVKSTLKKERKGIKIPTA